MTALNIASDSVCVGGAQKADDGLSVAVGSHTWLVLPLANVENITTVM